MPITSTIIGTLGGTEINNIPINFENPSSNGTYNVITIPIPNGKLARWYFAMDYCAATNGINGSSSPQLQIGSSVSTYGGDILRGMTGTSTSPVVIQAIRKSSVATYSAAFTGGVVWWLLD